MELPELVTLPIDAIRPYPNNPRRIPQNAIDAVANSIRRYGYQQPIVVDSQNVIVVGHTRHLALKQLGHEEVQVYVASDLTAEKIREYRLIDNRTSEMTDWDHGALVMELREFEEKLLADYFPEIDLEIGIVRRAVNESDIREAERKVQEVVSYNPLATMMTRVQCPSCFHIFPVRTSSLPGMTYEELDQLAAESKIG